MDFQMQVLSTFRYETPTDFSSNVNRQNTYLRNYPGAINKLSCSFLPIFYDYLLLRKHTQHLFSHILRKRVTLAKFIAPYYWSGKKTALKYVYKMNIYICLIYLCLI